MASFRFPAFLTVLLLSASACTTPSLDGGSLEAEVLEPGRGVTVLLASGGSENLALDLVAGQAAMLEVSQQSVDAVVEVIDPDGSLHLSFDSPTLRMAPERLCLLAGRGGRYRLRLRPFQDESGSVTVMLLRLRTATAGDQGCAEASRLFMTAESGRRQRGASPPLAEEYERAASLWAAAPWPPGTEGTAEAIALRQAGQVRLELGESRRAVELFERGAALARGEASLHVDLLNHLTVACHDRGELIRAESLATIALERARQADCSGSGCRRGEAAALNNLGLVTQNEGATHRAMEFYRRSLEAWEALDDELERAWPLLNLADALGLLDRHDEALNLLDDVLAIARRHGDTALEADVLFSLGWTQHLRGRPEAGLAPLRQALEIRSRHGDRNRQAATLDRLGTLLRQLGRYPEALATYQRSFKLQSPADSPRDRAAIAINLACLYQEWRDAPGGAPDSEAQADHWLGQARRLLTELPHGARDPREEAHLEYCAAQLANRRGEAETALAAIERSLALVDGLRETARRQGGRYQPIWLWQDYAEFHVTLLVDRFEATGDAAFARRAFEAADIARARNFYELILESGVDERAGGGVARDRAVERLQQVQQRLNQLEAQRQPGLGGSAGRLDLEDAIARTTLDLEAARAAVRAAGILTSELLSPRAAPLPEVQAVLAPDSVLLSYFLGRDESFLFAVRGESLSVHRLGARRDLELSAATLHKGLRHSQGNAAQQRLVAQRLAAALLPSEVLAATGTRRLLIAADGTLHYLPFAILPLPGASGPQPSLLLDAFEIQSVPSGSILTVLRRRARRPPPPATLALYADPVFGVQDERLAVRPPPAAPAEASPGSAASSPASPAAAERGLIRLDKLPAGSPPRLPFTGHEADAILALLPAQEAAAVLDRRAFAATKNTVLADPLGRFRYLHFATHAKVDEFHPDLSGLLLSAVDDQGRRIDGQLFLHEIYGLELQADLVVLSGCQTALGRPVRGDGLVGLTRGFLYAGASRVLVSLWSVHDEATSVLMTEFYRGLLQRGESPAAALRAAQQQLRATPRWSSPYYWAPFIVLGDTSPDEDL